MQRSVVMTPLRDDGVYVDEGDDFFLKKNIIGERSAEEESIVCASGIDSSF